MFFSESPKRDSATVRCRVSEKLLDNIDSDEKIVEVKEVMGNKNASLLKGPNTGLTKKEEEGFSDSATSGFSRDGLLGPSQELLASLQSLGENSDYTLLPHSLHQIAEAYSLKGDYQWAIQFLQLERLYHERLLSNLAALQENWERECREKRNTERSLLAQIDTISQKHIETLSQICRTHPRPSISLEKNTLNTMLKDIQSKNQSLQSCHDKVKNLETSHEDGEQEQNKNSESLPQTGHQEGGGEDGGEEEEELYEEGQEIEEDEELCEETPEEEEVGFEWPAGVPQASEKDLAKLSHTEWSSSPDCLVSILKRRRASLDGLPPPGNTATKQNSKRRVRFSEPEDGIEQDEVFGDSCLILLLLCLFTVVISIGGTAVYCTLVDNYSNICIDFSHNVNFYITNNPCSTSGFMIASSFLLELANIYSMILKEQ